MYVIGKKLQFVDDQSAMYIHLSGNQVSIINLYKQFLTTIFRMCLMFLTKNICYKAHDKADIWSIIINQLHVMHV